MEARPLAVRLRDGLARLLTPISRGENGERWGKHPIAPTRDFR